MEAEFKQLSLIESAANKAQVCYGGAHAGAWNSRHTLMIIQGRILLDILQINIVQ